MIETQGERERRKGGREGGRSTSLPKDKIAIHNVTYVVTYLILVIDTVATLHDVLLDVPQVDGGRQFPPLPTALSSAPYPDWQVLVDEKGFGASGNSITRLPLPDLRPLQEHIIAWLIATISVHMHIAARIHECTINYHTYNMLALI